MPMIVVAQCDQCTKIGHTLEEHAMTAHPPEGWIEYWERLSKGGPLNYKRTFCSAVCLMEWTEARLRA